MKLKEIIENEVYYYTEVFENASEIIAAIESLDLDERSFQVLEKWRKDNSDRLIKNFYMEEDLLEQMPDDVKNKIKWVFNSITEGIEKVANQFYKDKNINEKPNLSKALHICKYYQGDKIGFHIDGEHNKAVKYTIAIYWNNNYKGGELAFVTKDIKRDANGKVKDEQPDNFKFKTEPGSVLIFPASEPFYHSSLEVQEGFKYFTGAMIYIQGFKYWDQEDIKKYIKEN
jgi:hypothetical protein